MSFKLKADYFTTRIPLCIYRKGKTIFFQIQHEILGSEGYRGGTFCEYAKLTANNISEIGLTAQKLLDRFDEISDFTRHGLEEMLTENKYEFLNQTNVDWLTFMEAKDRKKITTEYDCCSIGYSIPDDKYEFNIWWHKKGYQYLISCDSSQGEKGILTFEMPLEFTDYSDPDKLGEMIVEALDRSRKISDKAAGNPYPEKTIELLSGAKLTVSAPRDKHFSDYEDYGIGVFQ